MMKLIRTAKGKNEFSFKGLTLGKVMAIRDALQACKDANCLGPVGGDVLDFLSYEKVDEIVDFGDSHLK
jgi:hypothetical protein